MYHLKLSQICINNLKIKENLNDNFQRSFNRYIQTHFKILSVHCILYSDSKRIFAILAHFRRINASQLESKLLNISIIVKLTNENKCLDWCATTCTFNSKCIMHSGFVIKFGPPKCVW